jgi:RimJ/RimL family protein N-acetyltransferase
MKQIETAKFILRNIAKGDEFAIAKNINDKTISRNTATIPYPYKLKDAEDWIKVCLDREKEKDPTELALAVVIDGEVCGAVSLHKIKKNHKAEIGYWLAKKYWGRGIFSEVIKIVTELSFKKFKLRRIYAGVYSFNPASMKVLIKNGYVLEGVLKKDIKKGGRLFDKHIYAKVK